MLSQRHESLVVNTEVLLLKLYTGNNVTRNLVIRLKATGVFCVVPICGLAAFPIR